MRLLGTLLLLVAGSVAAQATEQTSTAFPTLPAFVLQPTDFVPSGWKLIAVKSGDLNGDDRPDAAVLMRMADPTKILSVDSSPYYKKDDTNPYLLAIGFARGNGYVLAASNRSLFPDETAPFHGDDPPDANTVRVEKGILTLSFGHIRSFDRLRFRWNGKAFALVGYDCAGISGGTIYGLSANYLTHRARIERGEVGNDKSHFWSVQVRSAKRPTLDQINWDYGWSGKDIHGEDLSC
jgi:hypothetical protein